MTGPEHYLEAERLVEHGADGLPGYTRILLANVHATLALAAATALPGTRGPLEYYFQTADGPHWVAVADRRRAVAS